LRRGATDGLASGERSQVGRSVYLLRTVPAPTELKTVDHHQGLAAHLTTAAVGSLLDLGN